MTRLSSLALALTSIVCGSPKGDATLAQEAVVQGTLVKPAAVQLVAEEVAHGLDTPVYLTAPSGDSRLFVVEQPGRIRIVENGKLLPKPFLDIKSKVGYGGERGLLSVAFHPQ